MTELILGLLAAIGFAAAIVVGWTLLRERQAAARALEAARLAEESLARARDELSALRGESDQRWSMLVSTKEALARAQADLAAEQRARAQDADEHRRALGVQAEHDRQRLAELDRRIRETAEGFESRFKALAGDTLRSAQEDLLKLAAEQFTKHSGTAGADLDKRRAEIESMVRPIADTLKRTEATLGEFERRREQSFAALGEQVRALEAGKLRLEQTTRGLTDALKRPEIRGRYGEVQLRRVVELAGMRPYCDFAEQSSAQSEDGKRHRPDLIVRLPSGRTIIVDAKTNISAYVDAMNDPDNRDEHLGRFAAHVADQVKKLGARDYAAQFDAAADFVIMFVPGDQFVDAALARRPDLIETAADARVILASPSTLIGLLRAVEMSWSERRLAEDAEELRRLGAELLKRAATAMEHFERLGRALGQSVEHYNKFVGSYSDRLLPTLRRFEESKLNESKPVPAIEPIDVAVKVLHNDARTPKALPPE